jgi:hypothetical protein
MAWEWYQHKIAEFFRCVPGARVQEDVEVDGKSGEMRQLDVQVFLPMKVELGQAITVTVDIHIIVDAKEHERPVGPAVVGQINELRTDVGAHLAIIACPNGYTKLAKRRAPDFNVELLTVTSDLLAMLDKVEIPWGHMCHNYACEDYKGFIDWKPPAREGATTLGTCGYCNTLHVLCPDCGMVFPVNEYDEGRPLKCPGCERIYRVDRDTIGQSSVEVRDQLDVELMKAAYENQSKQITSGRARKIIEKTKWQYHEEPIINLTESGLMEWIDDGELLRLTEDGIEDY